MKWIKKIVVVVLVALVGIQFFPAKRNQDKTILSSDFTKTYDVPVNIQTILKTSCYDCHSNYTEYPWYNKIQPITWLLENHIAEGKAELNFSEFGDYSKRRKKNKLKSIASQVKDNEMPLSSYTLIHSDAKLSEKEKTDIVSWIEKNIN
tara:strand:+ start:2937 stop:3383 length:447 start_codon:yes stop_codon:yes gene_type:complete